ncbi:winged helix-turn-helix domain-containing protein [Actinomycetospora termitidis]|uniref:Transcriptional regulator n=1 Tax=Actinomycetospora termitidis TaxID=3053470 RepID=A0ABT7MHV7_9PSEU|nr:transcriptional regulator [Actinomycetospora sp. Odt1-22]MDL5160268.1 transcriptional regulator [Actinomycetospora sp. Odt1-22]
MTPARDPVFEVGPRLAIGALLQGAAWADFATVRDAVGAGDSVISKHARSLEDAGYLEVRKGAVGRRPRTWFRLTGPGRSALESHLAWLTSLSGVLEGTDADLPS